MTASDADKRSNTNGSNELYVGYLPTPPRYRRFLFLLVPLMVLGFVAAGVLLARSYRSPGNAVWDTSQPREFEGVIAARPYAMIRVADDGMPGGVRTMLLVQEGKRGGADLVADFDGKPVVARGYVLEGDNRRLLEVIEPIRPLDAPPAGLLQRLAALVAEPRGRVSLRGEIIDPKCYFGAMKPGEGKTHKACATLCISGGIPPMFLTRDAEGNRSYYLLCGIDGAAINQAVLPFVADPVEVSGELERWGDLSLLRIDPGQIRRM